MRPLGRSGRARGLGALRATRDWLQVPGWGASVSPTVLAPPLSMPTVAPEQQFPLWCFLWKGGCTTDKARRVREGTAARMWSHLEMCTLPFPTLPVVWAADCSFSGSSLRFVLALWVNHVRRSHFNSHAFRSNYTFKWLNKSGRKHIYCRTKAVNIEILFYISITSRL